MRRPTVAAAVVAFALTFAACAETTVDLDADDGSAAAGSVPATTIAIVGTALELLPELGTEMSSLSFKIADEGGQKESLARMEAIWIVIRPEIQVNTPKLLNGFDTTMEMSRTAVNRIRPADADKAFQLFSDLVDRFTDDG